jgi:hypothetical protein
MDCRLKINGDEVIELGLAGSVLGKNRIEKRERVVRMVID